MEYFEVEVTRTVTERRKIYVSAENGDTAHDAAVDNAEGGAVKTQWTDPTVSYSTAKTSEIKKARPRGRCCVVLLPVRGLKPEPWLFQKRIVRQFQPFGGHFA